MLGYQKVDDRWLTDYQATKHRGGSVWHAKFGWLKLEEIREAIRFRGLSNLAVPREVKVIQELPRLGTGKLNHRELQRWVSSQDLEKKN